MEYLGVSAAQVIKEVTNTKFQIPKGMEEGEYVGGRI